MTQTSSTTTLHRTPQHFEVLDGLRGVAAIAVVIFHFMEIAIPDYKDNFIAHAYLAVDFFFCLSGFVIAYAYDGRLPQIGALSFFKLRLIRLQPLVVVTSVLGLVVFMLDPYSDLWVKYADKMWLMFIASCFMVPFPVVQERYFNLFHLNPPTWSLFWEYIANIFYAWVLVKLSKKWLWVLIVIATGACVQKAKPTLSQMMWITAIGTLLLIALAYVLFVFVDVPLRRFLSGRFVKARLLEKPVTVEQRAP